MKIRRTGVNTSVLTCVSNGSWQDTKVWVALPKNFDFLRCRTRVVPAAAALAVSLPAVPSVVLPPVRLAVVDPLVSAVVTLPSPVALPPVAGAASAAVLPVAPVVVSSPAPVSVAVRLPPAVAVSPVPVAPAVLSLPVVAPAVVRPPTSTPTSTSTPTVNTPAALAALPAVLCVASPSSVDPESHYNHSARHRNLVRRSAKPSLRRRSNSVPLCNPESDSGYESAPDEYHPGTPEDENSEASSDASTRAASPACSPEHEKEDLEAKIGRLLRASLGSPPTVTVVAAASPKLKDTSFEERMAGMLRASVHAAPVLLSAPTREATPLEKIMALLGKSTGGVVAGGGPAPTMNVGGADEGAWGAAPPVLLVPKFTGFGSWADDDEDETPY